MLILSWNDKLDTYVQYEGNIYEFANELKYMCIYLSKVRRSHVVSVENTVGSL